MSTTSGRMVALVPARAGSKRVPGKNIRRLAGHPLIAYTIAAARESGVFDSIVVSTDSREYAAIARHYGAEAPFLRPTELAGSLSPDIEWVEHALATLEQDGRSFDYFSILRPTSPFRQPDTIRRAWQQIEQSPCADSLRAVEPCKQHPGKMWVLREQKMLPLMPFSVGDRPWHSSQYQALPEVYVQNASLEIARCHVVTGGGSIAGEHVIPFLTRDYEGVDINDDKDWWYAKHLVTSGTAMLPAIGQEPFTGQS